MCFPLFACECGRAPLYCRPFSVQANAVFSALLQIVGGDKLIIPFC